ncbi:hypothetical protein GSY74_02680 [Sulfurovum sp. bin170]|uniref:hypothetical protein n=1 Tax=Sulfurovum sp. bin170 TaxID=2695268 RepID=UPI0013E06089|nr:hypothetical protein [Sulfurovum sp. bin170]NEW60178.1 hypothetical protein [Sulfurovum sp. bin170]
MRKLALISLLSSISLFAEQVKQIDESMPWMIPWLISSLLVIGLLFWSFYKAMKTKNPKYGYVILLAMLLLVGLMFV